MTSSPRRETDEEGRLDEAYVQDAFHSYLKSSLAQAKAERLLDVEILSGAEGDLMITGPAFTTNPPSVPLPRRVKSAPRHDLSLANCPVVFIPFLRLWSECVPTICGLGSEHQHDLARIICGLPPLAQPALPVLGRLAADLRSIAIEISQRRSFQDRYAGDLQAAIDVGSPVGSGAPPRRKASFVPPPAYTPCPTTATTPLYTEKPLPPSPSPSPPHSPHLLPPSAYSPPSSAHHHHSLAPAQQQRRNGRNPTIATSTSPAIELIRETLYAALADVFSSTPSLLPLLKSDPPRAYFGAVALAVLAVSSSCAVSTADGTVMGVRGVPLTLAECPAPLRPLMRELVAIGREAALIEEEDTTEVVRLVQEGREAEVRAPRLERARLLLQHGAGYDVVGDDGGRSGNGRRSRSAEGRAVAFANRVNALALAMTRLPQFRERQDDVFKVLAGVGVSS
ncbi:hypothetical protein BJV74DRAFT_918948 [Russula compacta]|nr:hypothetical protein BJV74DRAFT_918948 [Russula compacta]